MAFPIHRYVNFTDKQIYLVALITLEYICYSDAPPAVAKKWKAQKITIKIQNVQHITFPLSTFKIFIIEDQKCGTRYVLYLTYINAKDRAFSFLLILMGLILFIVLFISLGRFFLSPFICSCLCIFGSIILLYSIELCAISHVGRYNYVQISMHVHKQCGKGKKKHSGKLPVGLCAVMYLCVCVTHVYTLCRQLLH